MIHMKLKKILLRQSELNILEEYAREKDLSFEIWENGIKIYSFIEGRKNKVSVSVKPLGIEAGKVLISKKDTTFANMIEYILVNEREKKLLANEVLDKYKELTIINNISEKMSVKSDITEMAQEAFEQARKYISATYGLLILVEEKSGKNLRTYEYKSGENDQFLKENSVLISKVMDENMSDIINDVAKSPYKNIGKKVKSLICVPIMVRNVAIGAMIIGNTNRSDYNSEDLKLFCAIAFILGISLENSRLYGTLEEAFFQTVKALSETIEKRDTYTGGHVQRVTEYCIKIGEMIKLSREEMSKLRLAALMHDIGKIGIEDSILRKKFHLSEEEYWVMKKHTIYGAEILQNIEHLKGIVSGVREHHERYDGEGYPDGLVGLKIGLLGRIIAVADTFDAMITDRPYRKALSVEDALNELMQNSGKQFDPDIVIQFVDAVRNKTIPSLK